LPKVKSTSHNKLIQRLPRKDRLRFLEKCELVDLAVDDVLFDPRADRVGHVYFPIEGVVSLVTEMDIDSPIEVRMVGSEGMLGTQLFLGVVAPAPLKALVHVRGTALRVSAFAFRKELAASPALQRLLSRYVYVVMAQLASTCSCLHFHSIRERVARWLLMCQDRAGPDHLQVTHEFLAGMLGVRRVSVTGAASELKKSGLIRYSRGMLTIRDRKGLEAVACTCYSTDRQIYDSIFA
jgi:CRP-like cAMP-binding protein